MSIPGCNLIIGKAEFILKDELGAINNQKQITEKNNLSKLPNFKKTTEEKYVSPSSDWYPYCNSYYQHTEDVDAFARVSHLLAKKPSILSLNLSDDGYETKKAALYSEEDIQLKYLNTKPLNFIILGKPGIGEEDLGKQLASYWKCVYIDPYLLIQEEIDENSRIGQCIEYNLRCGRAIGIDIILRLLEKRIKTQSVQHRGFVLCGLPVIPNDLYKEDPISSEAAVFTARDIFEELLDTTIEIGVPPPKRHVSMSSKLKADDVEGEEAPEPSKSPGEEAAGEEAPEEGTSVDLFKRDTNEPNIHEPVDLGSISHSVCYEPEIGTDYESQLDFIFNLLENPFLIIYLKCPTPDAIDMREKTRFHIYTGKFYNFYNLQTIRSIYKTINDLSEDIPEEVLDTINSEIIYNSLNHLVTVPSDFACYVSNQLDKYHYTAASVIERRVLLHDPQYFLKIDSRLLPSAMFNILKLRLEILPFQKPIIPTILDATEDELGENTPIEKPNLDDMSPEEYFENNRRRKTPGKLFKWNLPNFGTLCPVSIKAGMFEKGKPQFATQFLNKIFFLRSEESLLAFTRNPRPYLNVTTPINRCRIFIFGSKFSGKTEIAYCLKYLLNGQILTESAMKKMYFDDQLNEYKEKVRQAALLEGVKILNERRDILLDEANKRRETELNIWLTSIRNTLTEYIQIEEKLAKMKDEINLSPFPMKMDEKVTEKYMEDLNKLKQEIAEATIPLDMNLEYYQGLVQNEELLLNFCSDSLKKPLQHAPATVTNEFVINYAEMVLKKTNFDNMDLETTDILAMYRNSLAEAENLYVAQGFHKGGWICDGMALDINFLTEIMNDYEPDDIIILNPSAYMPFEKFKLRHFGMFNDYKNLFLGLGKVNVAWRCPDSISQSDFYTKLVRDFVDEIVDKIGMGGEDEDDNLHLLYEEYKKELDEYNRSLDDVINFFQNRYMFPKIIDPAQKEMKEILHDLVEEMDNKNKERAVLLTDEDRAEEVKNIRDLVLTEDVGEGNPVDSIENVIENNRRYGDTSYYCPVTYQETGVLWRGKEEYAVKYQDKIYLIANKTDMDKFIAKPWIYTLSNPPKKYPPLRICVLGLYSGLNDLLCSAISSNLAVVPIIFDDLLRNEIEMTSENLSIIRNDESYIGKPIYEYLNNNVFMDAIPSIVRKLFHETPYMDCGFVVKNFPKRPVDVQFIVDNKFVPDLILNITGDLEQIRIKMKDAFEKMVKETYDAMKIELNATNEKIYEEYLIYKEMVFKQLLEDRRGERYGNAGNEEEVRSEISYDSVADQEDIDAVLNDIAENYPQPELKSMPDVLETMYNNIDHFFNSNIDQEMTFLEEIKEMCEKEHIPWKDINVYFEDERKTKFEVLIETNNLKEQRECAFDRCYDVTFELAESLLSCGYYFLSSFGRTCPVQYYERDNSIQMYLPLKEKYLVFPVIHRSYIYFICGRKALGAFKRNPIKYVNANVKFPLIPYRISIIGPPKCGKTCLARRFEQEFGFKYITRGQAVRYVLRFMPYSSLAKDMEAVLRNGWELTDEMVLRSVEAMSSNGKAVTQGIVFDGFPNIINEVRHMYFTGLLPNLVLDLQASLDKIFECLKSDSGHNFPEFSQRFIQCRYDEWMMYAESFRNWMDKEYQTLAKVETHNRWKLWTKSTSLLYAVAFEIKHYYIHIKEDWPLRLANMAVSPLEFLERQSNLKEYCPGCLAENELNNGGTPPDRTGLVQFKKHFYWVCANHIEAFLKCPDCYFSPYNIHSLPPELPIRIEWNTDINTFYQHGYCIVCNAGREGFTEFIVQYRDNYYLFDSLECLNKFMKKPDDFAFKLAQEIKREFHLDYKELPYLGMFEQYMGPALLMAISHVNKVRPIIPGLSIEASAAVVMGIRLKLNNKNLITKNICHQKMRDGCRHYYRRLKKLQGYCQTMKHFVNPYLYYEEVIPQQEHISDITLKKEESEESVSVNGIVQGILENMLKAMTFEKIDLDSYY